MSQKREEANFICYKTNFNVESGFSYSRWNLCINYLQNFGSHLYYFSENALKKINKRDHRDWLKMRLLFKRDIITIIFLRRLHCWLPAHLKCCHLTHLVFKYDYYQQASSFQLGCPYGQLVVKKGGLDFWASFLEPQFSIRKKVKSKSFLQIESLDSLCKFF